MIMIEGWVRMSTADLARIQAAAVDMIAASRAEDGCEIFSFAQDLADPELFRIIELWRDEAALQAHFAAPHMAAFQASMASITRQDASVRLYQASFDRVLTAG